MAATGGSFRQSRNILINNESRKVFRRICRKFAYYSEVHIGKVSPSLHVPGHISKPEYKEEGSKSPRIKTVHDQNKLRDVCKFSREVLEYAAGLVKEGVTTDEIDKAAHSFCIERNLYPSPLGYKGFPKSICTSVNNVVCHGIPDDRELINGDIINIDITVFKNGYHGDCSKMVLVGDVDKIGRDLVEGTKDCLASGISACYDGCPFSAIGDAVEAEADRRKLTVVPSIAGHGIGEQFHEPPDIYHFSGSPDCGIMRPGMAFTIEPALTTGGEEIQILEDGWTVVTIDGARSAQEEHTLLLTKNGVEILTTI